MRIAHVLLGRCNPDGANGVDEAVYHLSRHQAALGAEVGIVSLTVKEPIPVPGVEVKDLPPPFGRLARFWRGRRNGFWRSCCGGSGIWYLSIPCTSACLSAWAGLCTGRRFPM